MDFKQFNFDPIINDNIQGAGYSRPTPIQQQAIPMVLEGRDVLGLAQTGTGKTAAFALPILQRLRKGDRRRVRALVVAPTRELAEQIHDSFLTLSQGMGLNSATIYGGVGMRPQVEKLRRGTEIVVACPGRLLDHLQQGTIDLSRLEMLVLDEADQMFDMGFFPAIRKLLAQLPKKRQTLLFSATMPEEIRKLANEVQQHPVPVQVDRVAPATTVSHALYPVEPHLKAPLLFELVQQCDSESMLIFTRTKHRAKRLGEQLCKRGYKATSLQGNLSQNRRQEALGGFRDGSYQIMVATDIAARGIDVSQVSHVINYDVPSTAEAYIHRIGRTGRAARTGDALTLVSPEDAAMIRSIEKLVGKSIERKKCDGFDYSAEAPKREASPSSTGRGPAAAPTGKRGVRPGQKRGTGTSPGRRMQGSKPRSAASRQGS